MRRHISRDLRGANRLELLHCVYEAGSATRRELAAGSGLSAATVATVANELLEWGVLREVSFEDSGGGRPRARLAVNAAHGSIIGVDVAETYVQVDLHDMALNVRATQKLPLHAEQNHPSDVVHHIVAGIDAALAETSTDKGGVIGVGVSVPGQVDREGGVSVFAPNFSWQTVPFLELLGERLALPLHLDNPLKASAAAELWLGAGRDVDDLAVLTIGTGVGAGIVIDRSLVRGIRNCAGEWGHTAIVIDGRLCRCGNHGCIEAYVGAPGIMQQLRELAPATRILHPDDQAATITELAFALAEGDETAEAVLQETARYLGVGIANLINTLNPAVIVVGGWVTDLLGRWLVPAVRETAGRFTFDRTFSSTRIELSTLNRNPVGLGAAIFALEGYLAGLGVSRYGTSGPKAPVRLLRGATE